MKRVLAILARFPGEIKRVDRDTMPAQSRSGIKWHEPERLGSGGSDHLPHIYPHGSENHLELIDESDVNAPKDVLHELRGLGHSAGSHWHNRFNGRGVKRHGLLQAGWCV